MLKSALKYGYALLTSSADLYKLFLRSQVQRIVITSSCGTVVPLPLRPEPTVSSERDWNESVIEQAQRLGNNLPPMEIYCASKTLAEKGGFLNILFFDLPLICVL